MTNTDTAHDDVLEAHSEALHALSAALLANGAFESDEVHGPYERVVNTFKAIDADLLKQGWQHVAYYDEGKFHWMSGHAPRDCELYARIDTALATTTQPDNELADAADSEPSGLDLSEHFPSGLRSTIGYLKTGEAFESPIRCECHCGEEFAGTDEQEVRQLWAEHIAALSKQPDAADSEPSGEATQ